MCVAPQISSEMYILLIFFLYTEFVIFQNTQIFGDNGWKENTVQVLITKNAHHQLRTVISWLMIFKITLFPGYVRGHSSSLPFLAFVILGNIN